MTGQFTSTPLSTRLPIMATVKASYASAFSKQAWNMPFIWLPILLAIVASIFPHAAINLSDIRAGKTPTGEDSTMPGLIGIVGGITQFALTLSWTRFLVTGERPTGLYFGNAFWKYIGVCLLAGLVVGISIAIPVIIIFFTMGKSSPWLLVPLAIFSMPFLLWLATRCVLKFVGVCVSDATMTWKRSYAMMKGNVWPWIAGSFLAVIPFLLLSGVFLGLSLLVESPSLAFRIIFEGLMSGVFTILYILIGASFAGHAYRTITNGTLTAGNSFNG